jgi:hypothetical protein
MVSDDSCLNLETILVLLDFFKAFDSVCHGDSFILKLRQLYGFHTLSAALISSNGRLHRVDLSHFFFFFFFAMCFFRGRGISPSRNPLIFFSYSKSLIISFDEIIFTKNR